MVLFLKFFNDRGTAGALSVAAKMPAGFPRVTRVGACRECVEELRQKVKHDCFLQVGWTDIPNEVYQEEFSLQIILKP